MGNVNGTKKELKGGIQMYSPVKSNDEEVAKKEEGKDDMASLFDLSVVLQPYFWPSSGSDGALINRIRSSMTWVMVTFSKSCSLMSPIFLSRATNYLVHGHVVKCIQSIFLYGLFRFFTSFFKEMQSVVYLKVKQQANIQLAETAFAHVHTLSLNWHLSKKMGNVIRSMDRGTSAADNLVSAIIDTLQSCLIVCLLPQVTYLFLYLIPALLECIAVSFVFIFKFKEWQLSMVALCGVCLYAIVTIVITRWRKKFR